MENTILQTLIHCYQHSPSLVIIMNTDWEAIWANREYHHLLNLPLQLGIPSDHKENSVHRFIFEGTLQECRLLCNLLDGYRIAEISPCANEGHTSLRMDVDEITASVQSMTSACHALFNELNELELYDQTPLLNTMIGSCYRIYRMAYLQKEMERLQNGRRRNTIFSVNTAVRTLYQKCRDILRVCVDVTLENCDENLYLEGDMDEFMMAGLCAVTLCCRNCNHFQTLRISLTMADTAACLQVHSEQENAELPDSIQHSGDCEGEKAILTLFCQQHSGKWMFAEQPENKFRSCRIIFTPHSGTVDNLTLNSPRDIQEGRFYNKYETMLSCIHYRRMF